MFSEVDVFGIVMQNLLLNQTLSKFFRSIYSVESEKSLILRMLHFKNVRFSLIMP